MRRCVIIGISDSRKQWFSPEVMEIISGGHVFSGGKRHHDIMSDHLPYGSEWIDITVPLASVFNQYERFDEVIVFASGDPLFYGFASTVQRECPNCEITTYPYFNSLQLLTHRLNIAYQDMRCVSLTGRPWEKFDEALIRGERLIGCLTDHTKHPHAIWQRMQEYGYDNYRMYVGERLGNEEYENVGIYKESSDYSTPNCILLERLYKKSISFGIPDHQFHLLDGRDKMITKMPIRLATLASMDLDCRTTFWDVGFCTGSISIEARLLFPHLRISSFEIREEGRNLMALNSHKFGAPGIDIHIGDFCTEDISAMDRPDAVFIGGHGGKLTDMLKKIQAVLQPGGCIVFNSVSEESRRTFESTATSLGMECTVFHTIQTDDNNPITILKAQ